MLQTNRKIKYIETLFPAKKQLGTDISWLKVFNAAVLPAAGPYASVGIAMFPRRAQRRVFYRRAVSAVTARRGKNQIEFFDPEQMEKASAAWMEEHVIMTALDNQQVCDLAAAAGGLRQRRSAALMRTAAPAAGGWRWSLPPSLIERIESCGLIIPVGYWVMEEVKLASWWPGKVRDYAAAVGQCFPSAAGTRPRQEAADRPLPHRLAPSSSR